MIARPALLLALALLRACAADGPNTRVAPAPDDGPTITERKVDPDPEHISTGGKVALGAAAGVGVAVVGLVVLTGIAAAALMSNMSGP